MLSESSEVDAIFEPFSEGGKLQGINQLSLQFEVGNTPVGSFMLRCGLIRAGKDELGWSRF